MRNNPRFSPVDGDTTKRRYVLDPNGPLYAPKSAASGTIAEANFNFLEKALKEHRCSACGQKFSESLRVFTEEVAQIEAPLHLACAFYAYRTCPHLMAKETLVIAAETSISIEFPRSVCCPKRPAYLLGRDTFLAAFRNLCDTSRNEQLAVIQQLAFTTATRS